MSGEVKNRTMVAGGDTEPMSNRATTPVLLIGLLAVLAYLGMVNLDLRGGGFEKLVYEPYPNYSAVLDLQPYDPIVLWLRKGRIIFEANCAVCHQNDGSGSSANGCPPLVASEWVVDGGPNRIIRLVLNGGAGPIKVKETSYPGTTQMQAFGGVGGLSDEQIAQALNYVRNAWGNKADLVAMEQVKKIREMQADKFGPWTPAELLKFSDKD